MAYLKQILIIIGFSFGGELMHNLLPLPIPASIYGIILLFIALETNVVHERSIAKMGNVMLDIMPLLFVPPAIALIPTWGAISGHLWEYVLIMVATTFVVMYCSGLATQWTRHKMHKGESEPESEEQQPEERTER